MKTAMTPSYEELYAHACRRKGGEQALEGLLTGPRSRRYLTKLGEDRYLAEFTKKVFQSGFVWRVVEQKWQGFEDLFWGFNVDKLLLMPDEMLERKAADPAIIRNFTKVKAIRDNAAMIAETRRREGIGFGRFIASWPAEDIVGLWLYLKKHGARLGGNTGPYALRAVGVDSFLLTRDVEGFLRQHKLIEGGIGSQRALKATQEYFNRLRQESARSLTELSKLVSYNYGENRVGIVVDSN
jgi:3-methyladenine DNA glycosylase Tag